MNIETKPWHIVKSVMNTFVITLVEIAWTFYMLHGNMQAYFFLQNMEHSGILHGNIL